eukprot:2188597-Prymnesium_polylepis.1
MVPRGSGGERGSDGRPRRGQATAVDVAWERARSDDAASSGTRHKSPQPATAATARKAAAVEIADRLAADTSA